MTLNLWRGTASPCLLAPAPGLLLLFLRDRKQYGKTMCFGGAGTESAGAFKWRSDWLLVMALALSVALSVAGSGAQKVALVTQEGTKKYLLVPSRRIKKPVVRQAVWQGLCPPSRWHPRGPPSRTCDPL